MNHRVIVARDDAAVARSRVVDRHVAASADIVEHEIGARRAPIERVAAVEPNFVVDCNRRQRGASLKVASVRCLHRHSIPSRRRRERLAVSAVRVARAQTAAVATPTASTRRRAGGRRRSIGAPIVAAAIFVVGDTKRRLAKFAGGAPLALANAACTSPATAAVESASVALIRDVEAAKVEGEIAGKVDDRATARRHDFGAAQTAAATRADRPSLRARRPSPT